MGTCSNSLSRESRVDTSRPTQPGGGSPGWDNPADYTDEATFLISRLNCSKTHPSYTREDKPIVHHLSKEGCNKSHCLVRQTPILDKEPEQKMASHGGKFVVSADGTRIWAEETGATSKSAMVFLHGFGFSAVAFDKQFHNSTLVENLHLIRYDCRGHGRSDQPLVPDAYTSKRMAEDFKAVCEAFNLTRPLFVGWSFGGTHLSDICEHLGPDYISGAICLSVPPFIDDFSKITTEFMDSVVPVLVNPETSVADYSKAVVAITDASVADGFDLPIETKWLLRGVFHSQSPLVKNLIWQKQQDHTNLLSAGSKLPLLVIYGTEDKHINGKKMEEFARESFSPEVIEFHAIEESGHMPFYEHPEKTNGIILDWVARISH